MPELEPPSEADRTAVTRQLGRPARAIAGIAWRCPCRRPGVIATRPRLPDGAPFPTTYYLTCPRAAAACSRLESDGVMVTMNERLRADPELATRHAAAHRAYLDDRRALGDVPEIDGVSAGGMPDRVKCLHALAGHALACGPGVNPLGDEVVARLGAFWQAPCLPDDPDDADDLDGAGTP